MNFSRLYRVQKENEGIGMNPVIHKPERITGGTMKKFWRLIFVFGVLLALGGCSSVRKMTYIINRSERTGGTLYTCYSAESMDEKPEYVLLRGDVSEPYLKKTPTTDEDLVKDMKSSLALDSRDIILEEKVIHRSDGSVTITIKIGDHIFDDETTLRKMYEAWNQESPGSWIKYE